MLRRTHFFKYHEVHGHMTEFSGFNLPLWYKGVTSEVQAIRNAVGVFDVSHMGRASIMGGEAESYLNYITTNNVSKLKSGEAHYTVMCNERGGVIDDVVMLRLDECKFVMVLNAVNREKDLTWMNRYAKDFDVRVDNVSDDVAMMAVQGPKARSTVQDVSEDDVYAIKRFGCGLLKVAGEDCVASGTGYTGEDGLEIFVLDTPVSSPDRALHVWNAVSKAGEVYGFKPCGLGARDVLRIEAGMCLYGQELAEDINPYEARIGFVVKQDKGCDFIGREALEKQKSEGLKRVRVGLRTIERARIPRMGYPILRITKTVGEVTSGTFSPILEVGICMGYVPKEYSKQGTILQVNVRGKSVDTEVVKFPFYDTSRYGWTRTYD